MTYRPVFELSSRRLVGVEAVPSGRSCLAALTPGADELEHLGAQIAADLGSRPARAAGWWVSIGCGVALLDDPRALHTLRSVLADGDLSMDRVLLEVTADQAPAAAGNASIGPWLDAGARLSIKDFGLGIVSPSALRWLPIAQVRVSLAGLDAYDAHDLAVLRSVVAAAEAVGVTVLGEGIETDDQLHLVHEAGIGLVQGYRWGSPGSIDKLISVWGRQALDGRV